MSKNIISSHELLEFPREKPLFKYLKKEFSDKLFYDGELLIGTLYDFRNTEQHGHARGDKGEGEKEIYEYVKDQLIEDPSENNLLSPFVKQ
ncbi:hypothetical protein HY041_04425, partial [Candidatus Roizmanbacteria bacterium]|nr:hypothetical protein [Candidatus Roizmanbacteria bacterium]